MPLTLADSQLPAASATILAADAGGQDRRVDIRLFNTNTSTETVVITKTTTSGVRVVTKVALATLETHVVTGLALDPSNTLQGFTTTASKVDYSIEQSAPGTPFHIFTLAAGGGLKTVRSDVSRTIQLGTLGKVGAGAGWTVGAANNLPYIGTVAADQTAGTLVVPIDGLAIGDTITGFRIVAQVESAGGTVTIDAALRATTNAAGEPTDASIAAMTQVSVTADTAVSQAKTGVAEVVTSGKTYYLLVTVTTGSSCDVILQACEISYTSP